MDPQASQSNRDELIGGLKDLVKSLNDRPPGRRWLPAWLNTPIIVTCLGGIVVAWVTSVVQQRADTAAREREQIRSVQSAKLAAFTSFADDFPITHSRLYDLMYLYSWLKEKEITNGDSTENPARHKSGRTYAEMYQHWFALKAEFVKSRSFHSLIGHVEAAFDDLTILSTTAELEATMAALFYATNEPTVCELNEKANEQYTELVDLLSTDIRTGTTGGAEQ